MNKINDELKYINYDVLLLDMIYENRDVKLGEIIIPLIEDKTHLNKFIQILQTPFVNSKQTWLELIIKNISEEDKDVFEQNKLDTLLICSCKYGFLNHVKLFINLGANIHVSKDSGFNLACRNNHFEIVQHLVENGADIHADHHVGLLWACNWAH